MNKVKLILRADGDERVGLGHVMRLLAMAEILGEQFSYEFAIRVPSEAVCNLIRAAGHSVRALPEQPFHTEAAGLAREYDNQVFVLDGYAFDFDYQTALRANGNRLIVVDDLRTGPVVADVLINHSPGVTAAMYDNAAPVHFFLGPSYSLVRRPFLENSRASAPLTADPRLLICFGGADPAGLTARSVLAMSGHSDIREIGVITGSAFRDDGALERAITATPRVALTHYQHVAAAELAVLFAQFDVIICPASTVLIESLLVGCAAITGYFADNQRHLADFVGRARQAYSVGDFLSLSDAAFATALTAGLAWLRQTIRTSYVTAFRHQELRAAVQRLVGGA